MVCVSKFHLGRGGLTQLCINFLRYRTVGHFRSEKYDPEMGQAPTSQARPRDTDHRRPSYLAARTLILVERTLSKFGVDPCPLRRGLAPAVKCYVRKTRVFLCRQRTEMTHHYRRHCSWFQYDEGNTCFVFCFPER